MKHIITYTDNIEALRLKGREVVADHAELSLDEDGNETGDLMHRSKFGQFDL